MANACRLIDVLKVSQPEIEGFFNLIEKGNVKSEVRTETNLRGHGFLLSRHFMDWLAPIKAHLVLSANLKFEVSNLKLKKSSEQPQPLNS